MPTYSYRCTDCGNAFDIHQAFTDETLTECPVCGGVLRKIFSPVGVTFSGSGFYSNDSRSKSGGSSGSAGSSSSSSPSSSDSSASSTPSTPSTSSAAPAAKPATPSTPST